MTIRAPIYTRIAPSPRPAELLTWIETLPPGVLARTLPLRQSDWPNPTLRRTDPELRTWLETLPPGEISRTIPPRQSDWPNPVRRVSNPSLYSVAYSQQLQPVTVGTPFNQDDWPNPVRRVDNVELRTWVESLNVASIGAPFSQTDWPNPIRRVDSNSLRICINGVQLQPQAQPPLATGTIPNIFQRQDTGTFAYDLSVYFSGATSYAIAPAIEAGWTFDVLTAVLVIDTDAVAVFGPFTVTATNASGDTPSNAFTVEVAATVVDSTVTGGGFWNHLDLQGARRRKRLREIEEAEEESQRLKDETDREIALLLREQERKDEFRANLERLNALIRRHLDREAEAAMSERVQKALARAMAQESVSALIALQRELDRMLEEEEVAIIMLLNDQ